MKLLKLIILTVIFSTSTVIAAEHGDAKPAAEAHPYTAKTPKLNRAQVDELLAKPTELVIVDVRRPDELSKIGGFPVYLSIQSKDIEKGLSFIPGDRKLVTVSNHAGRAGKTADFLAEKGFKVVGAIGAQDYEAEGGALTKIEPPAPKSDADKKH
ncbi:rhodanese-like domain-containing protein [Methylomonas sp. LL1]|uniref:rhodanese-like domain-containing protein n=1 Tax=Methylomonas sp. LL1 TaxID=2785785 RepID=UPI0018C4052F|nr:rhodanese-like domain-containing protein [Methylomonas sp. LL1]QPK64820.1 rhodanese-like domain-containing protein [Methylomonas sp. LL1]